MQHVRLAERINRLPFETWFCVEMSAQQIGLTPTEAETVLRAGRRRGMLTVRRENGAVEFMRVRRHPAPTSRRSTKRS
ncbi:hypothetical protein OHS33_38545 (plasmid) [Streptomyces sp. NBC_00536]|uniref:hypothetical protein n=1 Tax=Streptomyces sp. NBC_00536 TaxID=2975769 RepID=UPI002E80104E|nr:hypothetical protein [Streptomyces sp. NBC_00536]WUC84404.1 hypothetical protein OHS33_38545 [Streptomyces sp. NBC_00536]